MIKKVIQLRGAMQTVCVTLTRTVMLNLGSDGCKPASEPLISCAAMGQASRAQHSVIPACSLLSFPRSRSSVVALALTRESPCMRLPGR